MIRIEIIYFLQVCFVMFVFGLVPLLPVGKGHWGVPLWEVFFFFSERDFWSKWLFVNPYIWNSWGYCVRIYLPVTNIKSFLFIFVSGGTWTVLLVIEGLVAVLSSEGIEENSEMWRVFVEGGRYKGF